MSFHYTLSELKDRDIVVDKFDVSFDLRTHELKRIDL